MKSLLAVVVFLAGMQFTAVAQETFLDLEGRPLPNTVLNLDKSAGYDELSIGIRIPFLTGNADNGGDKWTDLFHSPGIGFNLEGSFLWAMSDKVALGIYTSFDLDNFNGKSQTVDVGNGPETMTLDHLLMTRFLVGFRIRETFRSFFMDQSIGFGWANYSAVNAHVSGVSIGVLDNSFEFAFDLTLRLGFVVSRVVDLGMSVSYNYNGAPSVASDLSQADPGLKFDAQSNAVIAFFINLNF
jgi:hypothetical protein